MRHARLFVLGSLQPLGDEPFEREAARAFEDLLADSSRCMASGRRWLRRGIRRAMLFWQRLPYPETSWHAELAGVYAAPALRERGFVRVISSYLRARARERSTRRSVSAKETRCNSSFASNYARAQAAKSDRDGVRVARMCG